MGYIRRLLGAASSITVLAACTSAQRSPSKRLATPPTTPFVWADRTEPEYPRAMADANIEGEVLLRFVVDTSGAVDPWSVGIRASSGDAFTHAARSALLSWTATPARRGGRPVSQVAFHHFDFRLTNGRCAMPASLGADSTVLCATARLTSRSVYGTMTRPPLRDATVTTSPTALRVVFPRIPLDSLGCGRLESNAEGARVRRYFFLVTNLYPSSRYPNNHMVQTGVNAYLPAGVALTPARLDSVLRAAPLTVDEALGEPPMLGRRTQPASAIARFRDGRVILEIEGEAAVRAFTAAGREDVSLDWCERTESLLSLSVPLRAVRD